MKYLCRIIESKSTKFPVGKYVDGQFGWKTYAIVHENFKTRYNWSDPSLVSFEPEAGIPVSLALGVLGMPG